eukprot:TRINITY_DN74625_c0_g1_i1.p1 TRINITY_DN74625_c0_g1~~TRINITY_DN74625_c0_g1_i1.p1  ORF type:complete len:1666 (+),score=396.03 TRINITY_DN74625_c0_g1_i1:123-5120(+)
MRPDAPAWQACLEAFHAGAFYAESRARLSPVIGGRPVIDQAKACLARGGTKYLVFLIGILDTLEQAQQVANISTALPLGKVIERVPEGFHVHLQGVCVPGVCEVDAVKDRLAAGWYTHELSRVDSDELQDVGRVQLTASAVSPPAAGGRLDGPDESAFLGALPRVGTTKAVALPVWLDYIDSLMVSPPMLITRPHATPGTFDEAARVEPAAELAAPKAAAAAVPAAQLATPKAERASVVDDAAVGSAGARAPAPARQERVHISQHDKKFSASRACENFAKNLAQVETRRLLNKSHDLAQVCPFLQELVATQLLNNTLLLLGTHQFGLHMLDNVLSQLDKHVKAAAKLGRLSEAVHQALVPSFDTAGSGFCGKTRTIYDHLSVSCLHPRRKGGPTSSTIEADTDEKPTEGELMALEIAQSWFLPALARLLFDLGMNAVVLVDVDVVFVDIPWTRHFSQAADRLQVACEYSSNEVSQSSEDSLGRGGVVFVAQRGLEALDSWLQAERTSNGENAREALALIASSHTVCLDKDKFGFSPTPGESLRTGVLTNHFRQVRRTWRQMPARVNTSAAAQVLRMQELDMWQVQLPWASRLESVGACLVAFRDNNMQEVSGQAEGGAGFATNLAMCQASGGLYLAFDTGLTADQVDPDLADLVMGLENLRISWKDIGRIGLCVPFPPACSTGDDWATLGWRFVMEYLWRMPEKLRQWPVPKNANASVVDPQDEVKLEDIRLAGTAEMKKKYLISISTFHEEAKIAVPLLNCGEAWINESIAVVDELNGKIQRLIQEDSQAVVREGVIVDVVGDDIVGLIEHVSALLCAYTHTAHRAATSTRIYIPKAEDEYGHDVPAWAKTARPALGTGNTKQVPWAKGELRRCGLFMLDMSKQWTGDPLCQQSDHEKGTIEWFTERLNRINEGRMSLQGMTGLLSEAIWACGVQLSNTVTVERLHYLGLQLHAARSVPGLLEQLYMQDGGVFKVSRKPYGRGGSPLTDHFKFDISVHFDPAFRSRLLRSTFPKSTMPVPALVFANVCIRDLSTRTPYTFAYGSRSIPVGRRLELLTVGLSEDEEERLDRLLSFEGRFLRSNAANTSQLGAWLSGVFTTTSPVSTTTHIPGFSLFIYDGHPPSLRCPDCSNIGHHLIDDLLLDVVALQELLPIFGVPGWALVNLWSSVGHTPQRTWFRENLLAILQHGVRPKFGTAVMNPNEAFCFDRLAVSFAASTNQMLSFWRPRGLGQHDPRLLKNSMSMIQRALAVQFLDGSVEAAPACPSRGIVYARRSKHGINTDKMRSWSNVDEIMKLLHSKSKLRVKEVDFSNMKLAQQALVMAGADIVMTVPGANWANAVFLRPGTIWMDILCPNRTDIITWLSPAFKMLSGEATGGCAQLFDMRYLPLTAADCPAEPPSATWRRWIPWFDHPTVEKHRKNGTQYWHVHEQVACLWREPEYGADLEGSAVPHWEFDSMRKALDACAFLQADCGGVRRAAGSEKLTLRRGPVKLAEDARDIIWRQDVCVLIRKRKLWNPVSGGVGAQCLPLPQEAEPFISSTACMDSVASCQERCAAEATCGGLVVEPLFVAAGQEEDCLGIVCRLCSGVDMSGEPVPGAKYIDEASKGFAAGGEVVEALVDAQYEYRRFGANITVSPQHVLDRLDALSCGLVSPQEGSGAGRTEL